MEPAITGHEAVNDEDLLVHDWRVSRLVRLGIPAPLAEMYVGYIDWHQIARLVQRGSGGEMWRHDPSAPVAHAARTVVVSSRFLPRRSLAPPPVR